MEAPVFCDGALPIGYLLVKKLGSGLFGSCYLCKNFEGQTVVIKKYDPKASEFNRGKEHYEATIMSSLSHCAIPSLFSVLRTQDAVYLILEYIPGFTIGELLFQNHKVFSDLEISRIGMQLLSVMNYLHNRNIVHRDISIDNIVDNGTSIFLIDFGLARSIRHEHTHCQADLFCFGEVLLFLLYSRHKRQVGNDYSPNPWYHELKLTDTQKEFIRRLQGLGQPFETTQNVIKGFTRFMNEGLSLQL